MTPLPDSPGPGAPVRGARRPEHLGMIHSPCEENQMRRHRDPPMPPGSRTVPTERCPSPALPVRQGAPRATPETMPLEPIDDSLGANHRVVSPGRQPPEAC